jgi:hypothetical protein
LTDFISCCLPFSMELRYEFSQEWELVQKKHTWLFSPSSPF